LSDRLLLCFSFSLALFCSVLVWSGRLLSANRWFLVLRFPFILLVARPTPQIGVQDHSHNDTHPRQFESLYHPTEKNQQLER
ncbi:hypothetical protein AAGG49_22130, partial [Stenotrophomonas maltophilia]|uniref:hypothetical protein n=1 Tax=Stenotrophomonas maltophilia TaxID=40324 RepID=UPI00313D16E9